MDYSIILLLCNLKKGLHFGGGGVKDNSEKACIYSNFYIYFLIIQYLGMIDLNLGIYIVNTKSVSWVTKLLTSSIYKQFDKRETPTLKTRDLGFIWSINHSARGDYPISIDNDPSFLTFYFFIFFSSELLVCAKYKMVWYVCTLWGQRERKT